MNNSTKWILSKLYPKNLINIVADPAIIYYMKLVQQDVSISAKLGNEDKHTYKNNEQTTSRLDWRFLCKIEPCKLKNQLFETSIIKAKPHRLHYRR